MPKNKLPYSTTTVPRQVTYIADTLDLEIYTEAVDKLIRDAEGDIQEVVDLLSSLLLSLLDSNSMSALDKGRFLISRGADVNILTPTGSSPLMQAAMNNSFEWVRLLLVNGASVNAQDALKVTALHQACMNLYAADFNQSGFQTEALNTAMRIIQLLVAFGANQDLKDSGNKTAVEMLSQSKLGLAYYHDNKKKLDCERLKRARHYSVLSDYVVADPSKSLSIKK